MQKVWVEKNVYRDSVALMHLSDQIKKIPRVTDVAVLMGTPANVKRLQSAGFSDPSLDRAQPSDLCIGVEAEEENALGVAIQSIQDFLSGKTLRASNIRRFQGTAPRTLESAARGSPDARLVSISVPGEYAAREARRSLELGRHVFLFSDNVPLEEEKNLKSLARERGLLMMGPDCGTALINGVPLGFCNRVPAGPVGLVAASGTGAQEVICRLAALGVGVSHVIGTGGRDLSAEVGGITFEMAMDALSEDHQTQVIVLVSKPPAESIEARILSEATNLEKPVVVCFVGNHEEKLGDHKLWMAGTLTHAADIATALVNGQTPPHPMTFEKFAIEHKDTLEANRNRLASSQRYVRGLYSGGTLADEAAFLLTGYLDSVRAGDGFGQVLPIEDWEKSRGHSVIDLGEDYFTKGRPHPMIDPSIRNDRIERESQDPSVAVLLLDLILGDNADEDPASKLVQVIIRARQKSAREGRWLPVVVHVCGTREDPQNLEGLVRELKNAECLVFQSNVEAAFAAAWIADGSKIN